MYFNFVGKIEIEGLKSDFFFRLSFDLNKLNFIKKIVEIKKIKKYKSFDLCLLN